MRISIYIRKPGKTDYKYVENATQGQIIEFIDMFISDEGYDLLRFTRNEK